MFCAVNPSHAVPAGLGFRMRKDNDCIITQVYQYKPNMDWWQRWSDEVQLWIVDFSSIFLEWGGAQSSLHLKKRLSATPDRPLDLVSRVWEGCVTCAGSFLIADVTNTISRLDAEVTIKQVGLRAKGMSVSLNHSLMQKQNERHLW